MRTDTAWFFDLDDTLYKEHTFVTSAYLAVARYMSDITGADVRTLAEIMAKERPRGFEAAIEAQRGLPGRDSISIDSCIDIYRRHWPDIRLDDRIAGWLSQLRNNGALIGIITDGTVLTQGTKVRALGLDKFIDPEAIFIGAAVDNLRKDFILPNMRGWRTVMIRDSEGVNIFPQNPLDWPAENRADVTLIP